ncbi:reverse transcriptase domain-containing protein [Tanacetum coccineum]
MSALKFADSHNMVAFLAKPTESEGFEQIVDFLNANPIKYALMVNPTIYTSCIEQFWATAKVKTVNGEVQLHALVDRKKVIITESIIRRDLQLEDAKEPIADEAANKENVPTHSNDPLLSGKDILKLEELMTLCTNLQNMVLDLEHTKTTQALEIDSLKRRVKKLEKKQRSRTHKLKRLFKVGRSAQVVSSKDEGLGDQEDASKQGRKITNIDQDAEVTLVDETQGRYDDAQMFDTDVFNGEEVFVAEQSEKVVEEVVSTAEVSAAATITTEEITLSAELRSAKPKVVVQEPVKSTTTTTPSTIPKAKSITFRDPSESTTRTTLTPIPSNIKDKGKAKMIEPEKPLKMKEQIRLDEELAFKLQAKEEEQARLAREKAEKVEEANISWDNVQAMIEADRLLAERLQAREQEELTDEEKARLFVELLEKRKKHFAALRAQEKRNKPPTKAQKKSTMSTYLKNMAGYKQSQLKNKSFAEIQKLFDKAMTRVNMFVDIDTELVKRVKKVDARDGTRKCMMAIFHDMIEEIMEVFMDDFSVFGDSFSSCLSHLEVPFHGQRGHSKALPTNEARVVIKILKSLFARFGTPRAIISDHGNHFCNDQFAKVMLKYGFTHRLSTAYHPQTSGQVKVSKRGLKRILERNIGKNRASWSDKLDDAFWAFHTAFKTPIRCTPYKLVYGKACHLPIDLKHKAYWALKHYNFDFKSAGDHQKFQMNKLNELRDQAYENSLIYKEKTKKIHDSKIKNRVFNVCDRVLLFNYRLKIFSSKLKTRWTGPFIVTQVFPYGTVELSQTDGPNFKVNGHRLNHYFGGDIPPKVVLDLQTFPIDH